MRILSVYISIQLTVLKALDRIFCPCRLGVAEISGLLEQGMLEEVEEWAEVLLGVFNISMSPSLPLEVIDVFTFRSYTKI